MEKQSGDRVDTFKRFVKAHPGMIKEVRSGNKTWQNFYEEWTILGEKDEQWNKYKEVGTSSRNKSSSNKKNTANLEQVFSLLKQVDLNQIQHYVSQFSGAMSTVQELLTVFQPNQNQKTNNVTQHQSQQRQPYDYPHPFFRD